MYIFLMPGFLRMEKEKYSFGYSEWMCRIPSVVYYALKDDKRTGANIDITFLKAYICHPPREHLLHVGQCIMPTARCAVIFGGWSGSR